MSLNLVCPKVAAHGERVRSGKRNKLHCRACELEWDRVNRERSNARKRAWDRRRNTKPAVKMCERPGCAKSAVMWPSDPRWCGHTCRIYCYRQSKKVMA